MQPACSTQGTLGQSVASPHADKNPVEALLHHSHMAFQVKQRIIP
jgi:hypothetical protein